MGQQSRSIFDISFPAAPGAVTQFRGVDFTGAQITSTGGKCIGIAKRSAAIGQSFEIAVLGTAICEAGAAIAAGQPVMMDTLGRVVPASALAIVAGAVAMTSYAANGMMDFSGGILPQWIVGDALEGAVAAGAFIEVLLSR